MSGSKLDSFFLQNINLAYIICLIDAVLTAVVHIVRKVAQACAGGPDIPNEEELPDVRVPPTVDVRADITDVQTGPTLAEEMQVTVNVQLNKEKRCRTKGHTTHRHEHRFSLFKRR